MELPSRKDYPDYYRVIERPISLNQIRHKRFRDAASFQLREQLAEPVGEDRDLDLLQQDAHDTGAIAGLEEECPSSGLTDGARHESVGRVEQIASSRHDLTLYRFRS